MKLPFRQGIVRHQKSGPTQDFLTPGTGSDVGKVTFKGINDKTVVTFADGSANYLLTERATILGAWQGPFVSGTTYWLYWDLNTITGVRTFGHTLLQPIVSAIPPIAPAIGQLWFDLSTNTMFERSISGLAWIKKIRVFAAEYNNATTFISMSINAPDFNGTQAGLTISNKSGALIIDDTSQAVKKPDGTFFTTEDLFATNVPTSGQLRISSLVVDAEAQQPMSSYTVVKFTDFAEISSITPLAFAQGSATFFGIIEEDVVTGEATQVTLEGVITNSLWSWPIVGAPLFVDNTGQLILTPTLPSQLPVAIVIDKDVIVLRPPRLELADSVANLNDLTDVTLIAPVINQYLGYNGVAWVNSFISHSILTDLGNDDHLQYLNLTRGDLRYSQLLHTHPISEVVNLQSLLDSKVDLSGDTLTGFLILNADPTLALHPATKQYVDSSISVLSTIYVDVAGDTMTGFLTLNADPTATLHAATKGYVDTADATKQPLDIDLTALAGLSSTGVMIRTGSGTATTRTLLGSTGNITIVNPAGLLGDPDFDLLNIGTPVVTAFVKITTDTKGRVSASTPVLASDITTLVNATYVNVSGDVMTGILDMSSFKITTLGTPTLAADAATKGYVDTTTVSLSGDSMTGNLIMSGATITGLPVTPIGTTEATSKSYVDSVAAGLDPKQSVRVATTVALVGAIYATSPSNGQFTNVNLTNIDGIAPIVGERVLVKNQVDLKQNGIYTVVVSGVIGTLTRSTDQDGSPSNEVSGGNFAFVEEGTVNADSGWVVISNGVLTLNTDNISWTLFTGAGTVTASDGIIKIGNDFQLDIPSLGNVAVTSVDEMVFHDISVPGTHIKRTVSQFIADAAITGSPGGANTQIQFNNSGVFGGDADFTWNSGTNTLALNGVISNAVGTGALPSYTFTGDLDTGMYHSAADQVSIAIAGAEKIRFSSAGVTVFSGFFSPGANTPATPEFSFTNDADTGFYRSAADTINFATGGISRMALTSTGLSVTGNITTTTLVGANTQVLFNNSGNFGADADFTWDSSGNVLSIAGSIRGALGGASVPSFTFNGDTDTGLYTATPDNLFVGTGGARRWTWDSVGNSVIHAGGAQIATTATDGFLYISSMAGVPTGIPTTYSGRAPIVIDTTNNRLYGYDPVSAVWLNLSGGSPGGANTQIQFNNSGVFDGDADFTWNSSTNTLAINGVISNALGTAALPSYTFTGDLDTGMYHSAANEISFALTGAQKVKFDATGITVFSGFFSPGTSGATAPEYSFTNDINTGLFRSAIDTLAIAANGIQVAAFGSTLLFNTTSVTIAPPTGGTAPEFRLREDDASGVNYVGFKAPATLAGNVMWTLPTIDGTSGQVLQTNGLGMLSFATVSGGGGSGNGFDIMDEFIFGQATDGTIGEHGWRTDFSGTPTYATATGDADHPGNLEITTSAATNDFTSITHRAATDVIFDSVKKANFIIKTGSTITDTRYVVGHKQAGLYTTTSNQVVFIYDTGIGPNWQARTANGATTTTTDTGVIVSASTYYELEIQQNTLGTYVFIINGTIVATISTNIPSGSAVFRFAFYVETLTTAARVLTVDRFGFLSKDSNGFGGTSPSGTNMQIQFNDAGVFGSDADFTWNSLTNTLAINGVISNALGTAALPSYTFTGDLDTGMYHSAANEISVAISGLQKVKIDSTGITVLSGFFSPGTSGATAPEFSFTNDPDTGMFRSAADILNFGVGGATILTIAASGITSSTFTASPGGKYLAPAGVPGVPTYTFTSDPASGIFNFAPGVVAISGAGMIAALFSSGGIFAGPPGSATAPSIAFFSDTDTGLYNSTANNLFVTTFGVQRFVWDSVGNAVVGTGALLTTATAGFLYITTTPGVPTGIPTTYTGRAALVLDTTGNALYGYDPISAVWLNLTGSGGGTPGGADTQVQFNDAGVFGGDSDFTWNKTTNTLTIVGTGTLAMQDGTISRPLLKDYAEVKTSPAVGATTTLDLENGNTFEVTLTQNTTVVISNPPASGNAGNFTFIVTQDGTGSRTITWPGSVRWSGGTPPTLTTTAGKTDILTFVTTDGGSTWYGFTAGLNY